MIPSLWNKTGSTSIARYVWAAWYFSAAPNSFSPVTLFSSHMILPPIEGPMFMDTQLGSIKHFTRQLPSLSTSARLIKWSFMTVLSVGSLNLIMRHSSSAGINRQYILWPVWKTLKVKKKNACDQIGAFDN